MNTFGRIISYVMAMLFLLQSVLGGLSPQKDGGDLRVSAYLAVNNAAAVENMDTTHLKDVTDLILIGGLAGFGADGRVRLGGDFDAIMDAITEKTRGMDIKVHLNLIGPGAVSGETWEEQMASMGEQHRQAFESGILEREIKRVLYTYPLNGVFFDYEYPLSDADKKAFGAFLVSLSEVLSRDHVIGCALSSWCAALPEEAIRVIDRVELMAYDCWDAATHAHSSYRNAKEQIRDMLRLGYQKEQIDLGLPFYARPTTQEAIWYEYKDCFDKIDEIGLMEDEANGVTASFNTPDLIYAKTKLAVQKKLGGVMIWHYACDVPADNEASLFSAIISARGELPQAMAYEEDKISMYEYDKKLVSCVPSERQLSHARTEFYALISFNVNTFTDREWGDGKESPSIFNPTAYSAEQWADVVADAGMKGIILVRSIQSTA